jgi:hydroxymethylpyrimidine/phosphomethylpyrimidine kinase
MTRPPVALTIAGSDPSGGAGIQADLKTFSALGVYGTAVITALTAQNTRGVTGVHVVPASFVTQQLETLAADVRLDAIKIGMLANAEIVAAVGDFLRSRRGKGSRGDHVVLDPVMIATSGDRLLDDSAVQAMRDLMPLASVITPNIAEAAALLDTRPARTLAEMRRQATALQDLGAPRVLLKGGHRLDDPDAVDLFLDERILDKSVGSLLRARRVDTNNTHGTGCTLSSALAALRPRRDSWFEAARDAKSYLTAALAAANLLQISYDPGGPDDPDPDRGGHGPVHHFHAIWDR